MLSESQNILRLREIETYTEKVRRWAGRDPLPRGMRFSNKADFHKAHVTTDGFGNIHKMPVLVEKPCFGIPTAYLRHGRRRAQYVARMKERIHNSRCDNCKVRSACHKVVIERLRVVCRGDNEFKNALSKWNRAGGLNKGGFDVAEEMLGRGGWTQISEGLSRVDFDSSNDEAVAAYWSRKVARPKQSMRVISAQNCAEHGETVSKSTFSLKDLMPDEMSAGDC